MKRLLSVLLSGLMIISIIFGVEFNVYAKYTSIAHEYCDICQKDSYYYYYDSPYYIPPAPCTEEVTAVLNCGHRIVLRAAREHEFYGNVNREKGIIEYGCLGCEAEYEELLSEHKCEKFSPSWIEYEPSCTRPGQQGGKRCKGCGTIYGATIIPALEHNLESCEDEVEPTCTEVGYTNTYFYCIYGCGYTEGEQEVIIPALGHEIGEYDIPPTCGKEGEKGGLHCLRSGCDVVVEEPDIIPPTGEHTEVIDKAVAPTCTESGLTQGQHCSVCGEVLAVQKEISATGHTEVIIKGVEPTCTESGWTDEKHCSVCDEVLVAQEEIPATGHTEVIVKGVAPTCTETGLTEGKHCSVCDEVLVAQETVKATGHTVKTVEKKSATYFAKGHTGRTVCKDCGEVISKGKATPKLKLKTPKATVKGRKKKLTVKYKKVKDATGFQVKYKIGKKSITKTYSSKKTVTKTIKNLKKGTYKVYVRAFIKQGKNKAYSNWSKAKSVKVK